MSAVLHVVLPGMLVAGLVCLGYWFAERDLIDEQDEIDSQRQALNAEWTALENSRRVDEVFVQARDELRRAEEDDA